MSIVQIELPDDVYEALNEWRRGATHVKQDPENSERTIVEPVFRSVDDYLREVLRQNIAQVLQGRHELPSVRQLKQQLQALEQQIKEAQSALVNVSSAAPKV
jgi:DNA repair exonuclease SbcCD ATPase subunit